MASFAQVERALRSLKPWGGRTFLILERDNGDYLQIAGGQVSCAVELRAQDSSGNTRQWRAYLRVAHPNYSEPVTKHFGAGTVVLQPDEVLRIDDTVHLFREFMDGQAFPESVSWRPMPEIS